MRFASWCVQGGGWWWWRFEMSWIATTHIGAQQLSKPEVLKWSEPFFEAFLAGAWFLYWTDDTLYWVAKPNVHVEVVNGARRLHHETRAAVESDVENLYFWHGVLVPAFVVVRPDWITVKHIEDEDNAEARRVMMERFGWDRYIVEGRFDKVHTDDFGTLYSKRVGDEDVLIVRVIDPSTGREYGLPVHPELMPLGPDGPFGEPQALTARNAVGSTFGKRGEEYAPAWER